MAWITLQPSDVQKLLTGPVWTVCQSALLAQGQSDPITEVLADAATEVRSRVAANRDNLLGPDGTIPDECRRHASALAAWDYLSRLQVNDSNLTGLLEKKVEEAGKFLRDVAAGRVLIVPPPTPTTNQVAKETIVMVSANRRQMTRHKLRGVL